MLSYNINSDQSERLIVCTVRPCFIKLRTGCRPKFYKTRPDSANIQFNQNRHGKLVSKVDPLDSKKRK